MKSGALDDEAYVLDSYSRADDESTGLLESQALLLQSLGQMMMSQCNIRFQAESLSNNKT